MKIVINTQILENYGAHDWDGKGHCPQYWKTKGGEVYVITGDWVSEEHLPQLMSTLQPLIHTRDESFEEYVANVAVVEDDAKVCEHWDTPFELSFEEGRGWFARRTVENGEYGYLNHNVASKSEEYDMLNGGERGNYTAVYTMRNGDLVNAKDVHEYLSLAA